MSGKGLVGSLLLQVKFIFSRKQWAFGVSILLRVLLLLWGYWQDENLRVKYTDIDYEVFTDGATFMSEGFSPYLRSTFRYTPLLGFILYPNASFKIFGKLLFVAADIATGYVIYLVLRHQGIREQELNKFQIKSQKSKKASSSPFSSSSSRGLQQRKTTAKNNTGKKKTEDMTDDEMDYLLELIDEVRCVQYTSLWLFNPFVFNVSTRGNADALIALLVVSTIYSLMKGKYTLAALLYGLSVHFKLYPVIYGLAFLLFIDFESAPSSTFKSFLFLFSWKRLRFSLISLGTFLGLTSFFYALYGYTFLFETYFYHFIRSDHRHNFSPQFYPTYLKMSSNSTSAGAEGGRQENVLEFFTILFSSLSIPVTPGLTGGGSAAAAHLGELGAYLEVVNKYTIGLSAWIPQLALILILTIVFYRDLPFCAFLITLVFVAFNKVITVQYFIWFFCLLPMAMRSTNFLIPRDLLLNFAIWYIPQAVWLMYAYRLEFLGENTFVQLWGCGIVFFCSNMFMVWRFVLKHKKWILLL